MFTVIIWSGASGKSLSKLKEANNLTKREALAFLKGNMPARHYPIFRDGQYYSAVYVG